MNVGNLLEISLFMAIIVVGALNYLDLARLSKLLFFLKKKDMHLLLNIDFIVKQNFFIIIWIRTILISRKYIL